jgi:hypothetical protein
MRTFLSAGLGLRRLFLVEEETAADGQTGDAENGEDQGWSIGMRCCGLLAGCLAGWWLAHVGDAEFAAADRTVEQFVDHVVSSRQSLAAGRAGEDDFGIKSAVLAFHVPDKAFRFVLLAK